MGSLVAFILPSLMFLKVAGSKADYSKRAKVCGKMSSHKTPPPTSFRVEVCGKRSPPPQLASELRYVIRGPPPTSFRVEVCDKRSPPPTSFRVEVCGKRSPPPTSFRVEVCDKRSPPN